LSASVNISASAFYGDGSNLTGLTASAVNVADGPEFSIQFRRDTPISGEISGSGALVFLTASSTLSLSSSLVISGTAGGFQSSEISFGTSADPIGRLNVEEDGGYIVTLAANGGLDLSGSDGVTAIIASGTNFVVASAYTNTGLALTNMSGDAAIDIGHDGAISGSGNLTVGGTSTFNSTATFNNNASVHNQGITVNNAAATINNNLVANGNITLGNASGDGVTWNAGSWDMSANAVVATLKDGVDGISGNGALMFFTGSGGDLMKFHTSGSAKGIVFPQQTYLSKGGALSGSAAGDGSYLALDSSNKIVITASSGGGGTPGGSSTQVQFNDGGSFGGDSGLVFDKSSDALTIGGTTKASNFIQKVDSTEHTVNFNITNANQIYLVNCTGSVITGTLPGLTADSQVGETYTIKDFFGSGSTNDIIIDPSGSQKIDGGSGAKIATDYGAMTVTAASASTGYSWIILSTN
tara:strand:- start:1632 stop:3035 length:1404 start_codon:yes stop_codon:yes gene_type:complete